MRSSFRFGSAISAVALLAGLAACASQPMYASPEGYPGTAYPAGSAYPAGTAYPSSMGGQVGGVEYGRVTNVELIRTQEPGRPGAAGAVIGGIAGAVIGHQIGRGTGKDLATIAGGVGGAVAGNAIQNSGNTQVRDVYRVSVQVDNGSYRAYDLATQVDLRAGDRVRIENGQLYRM
ncbi:glycine zipper 2TM domain-containing protein [Polaromonas sp.]|uniref:glycine zipper 2TM domain-containing protein n=1 Tax=Polaromonas sp. TaxID=1869339 RepID=UPI003BAA60BE